MGLDSCPIQKKRIPTTSTSFSTTDAISLSISTNSTTTELTELRNAIEILAKEVKELKEKIKGEK
jgi:hypothetical protein